MNPSTALARVVVDELLRHGVCDAVLSPGSRSAPLAMALHRADADGRLRLHVRIDERSAGFLALGLAKGSHRLVPVVTTSGTAVANLHPAVLEASHASVPLLVLSADRPAGLRGTGANQTTDQIKLFGDAVRWFATVSAPSVVPTSAADWRARVARCAARCAGAPSGVAGPVHLNVELREPLMPDSGDVGVLPGRNGGAPWTSVAKAAPPEPVTLPTGPRTVVVAGDDAGPPARLLAERAGWPLLAEPTSGARTGNNPVAAYRLLLEHRPLTDRIERVVVTGRPTLSRPVTRLLSRADVEVVVVGGSDYADPGRRAASVVARATVTRRDDPAWLDRWQTADRAVLATVEKLLDDESALTPYAVARAVSAAVPPRGLLVVGSSHPVRDLDLMAIAPTPGQRRMVMGNRGLAGIDGTVSTAIGASLGRRSSRSLAYVGDLTFLHDSNGLIIGPGEPRPDLTFVVASDDGGSIFATLEPGAEAYAASFERIFGTPTRVDIGGLCASMGVPHVTVSSLDTLERELAAGSSGIRVVEARIDRWGRRELDQRIRAAAAAALGAG